MALLLMGSAYRSNAAGSLMGGPEMSTETSGKAGEGTEARAGEWKDGVVVSNPRASAREKAQFLMLRPNDF